MSFVVPTFPLTAGVDTQVTPGVFLRRLVTPANLAYGRRAYMQFWNWADTGRSAIFSYLLVPALTDVRDVFNGGGLGDRIECPDASARFYAVVLVDDVGKGFSNEFRLVVMEKLAPWPTPIP